MLPSRSKHLYSGISTTSNSCMRRMRRRGLGLSICPMHWSANIPMRVASGYGQMSCLPLAGPSRDPRTGIVRRHHIHKLVLQQAVHAAVRQANITNQRVIIRCGMPLRRISSSGVRHSDGAGITRAQDVRTTMMYTHVLNRGGRGVKSPADLL